MVAGSAGQRIDLVIIVSAERLDGFLRSKCFPSLRNDKRMSVSAF